LPTPITQFLNPADQAKLTPAARNLEDDDLVALAQHRTTPRTASLTVADLDSIESAFHDQTAGLPGANVGGVSCCTCSPACCCSVAAEPVPFR
jgi:hypothetical protein